MREGAVEVLFTGLDRGVEGGEEQSYTRSLPLDEALRGEVLLAYDVNGTPLPPQHGFPLRLVVPGWYGMTSVKWLGRITVLDEPFDGYQMHQAYRLRHEEGDEGEPLSRIQVRALMVAPGIPEFLSRARVVPAGECLLRGRAWSGEGAVTSVEVSADGGETWGEAELDEAALGPWAWRGGATPGTRSRASTSSAAAHTTTPGTRSRSSRRGTSVGTRTTQCSASRSPSARSRRSRFPYRFAVGSIRATAVWLAVVVAVGDVGRQRFGLRLGDGAAEARRRRRSVPSSH